MMLSSIKSIVSGSWLNIETETTEINSKNNMPLKKDILQPTKAGHLESESIPFTWKKVLSMAKASTNELAEHISTSAKQISEKITTSSPYVEFVRAQTSFEADIVKTRNYFPDSKAGLVPWDQEATGLTDESLTLLIKAQVLRLTTEERNLLRGPPVGSSFQWSREKADSLMLIAEIMLKTDPNLAKMRYLLVPKRLKEDDFWRNYFYRISLIRQSAQLSALADQPIDRVDFNPIGDDDIIYSESRKKTDIEASPEEQSHTEGFYPSRSPFEPRATSLSPPVSLSVSPDMSVSDEVDDIEAELLLELESMERNEEHYGKMIDTCGEIVQRVPYEVESIVSIDEDLERELLAELEADVEAEEAVASDF